jgi:hypothetical protein
MSSRKFPQTKEYELSLLLAGDPEFKELREYIDAFIKAALKKFEMTQSEYNELYTQLTADIRIAAERFLNYQGEKKEYKFSTYYSWYLSERLNKSVGIKRKKTG